MAHDDVIGTSPEAGATVQAGVTPIELEFSAELLTIEESAEIIVLDPSGELVNNGCATITGRISATLVDLDQVGTHTVSWRAVSSDGHPIEGTFEFEVANESGYQSGGIVRGTECDWAISELTQAPDAETGSAVPGWIYWLIWLALPLAGIGVFLWLRPRPKPATEIGDWEN